MSEQEEDAILYSSSRKQSPLFANLSISFTIYSCYWWELHTDFPLNSSQSVISTNTLCALHSFAQTICLKALHCLFHISK